MVKNQPFEVMVQSSLGVELSAMQREQFAAYKAHLLSWNQQLNLTAVRTAQGIETTHFLDSLSCLLVMNQLHNQAVIDVGTGAGFPGIPLKIIFPTMRLTLVESVQKKARFLESTVELLGLEGVTVISERAEAVGQDPAHREQYDWAVARALAEMRVLVEYLSPLVRSSGHILAMKGATALDELQEAEVALQALNSVLRKTLPVPHTISQERELYLLLLQKMGETPERYPRRVGIPTKRPLS